MASQVCRTLSEDTALRADHEELSSQADAFEDMAIALLDAIRNSDDAFPVSMQQVSSK